MDGADSRHIVAVGVHLWHEEPIRARADARRLDGNDSRRVLGPVLGSEVEDVERIRQA